jgi:hypothetical protein
VKIAASAAISENIPTRPREGRAHSGSIDGRVIAALLNRVLLSIGTSNPDLPDA